MFILDIEKRKKQKRRAAREYDNATFASDSLNTDKLNRVNI